MGYKCIYNGVVLTMNKCREIIEDGVVVIKDKEIIETGNRSLLEKYNFDEMIDADRGIIMPGFINGHSHVSMSIFRSLGEDVPDRLRKYLFPLEDKLVDEELVRIGARLGIAEMIMGGVTTFADMYYFEDEVAKASKELGMRAIVGETVINRIAPDTKEGYEGLKHAVALIEKWKGDDLIIPAFAPHATYTNDKEHLQKIRQLSDKHGAPILIHISEMEFEMEEFREKYDMSPVAYLDSIGFLTDKVIGAHLVYVDDEDIDLLAKREVGVIHNITANAKGGRGVSPAPKMLKRNVKVGLGTDGPMSGNTIDIIGILDQYTKIQKYAALDNTVCPSIEAVELGTIRCAEAIHMDEMIGSLEEGKRADVIIINTHSPNMQPIYDYYSALVYSAYPHDVSMTMINGTVVMKDRTLLSGNLDDILSDVYRVKEQIVKSAKELECSWNA